MVESNLSEISSESVRSILNETIEKRLKTKNFEINVNAATKQGDNFIGIVQRVTFNKIADSKDQNGDNHKSLLILKTAPTNLARREGFFSRPCFLREIYLYNEVLPYFKQFQESKGVNIEDIFNKYPECYRTSDIEPTECLLLEDLTTNDFSMIDRRRETITADHVKLIMKSLGKFHAISFALRDQQPEKFKEFTANMPDILMSDPKPEFVEYFEMMKKSVYDSIANEEDAHLVERLNKLYVQKQTEISAECVDGKLAEPYAVVCHGDCWTNNTMFKYDDKHKPIEVCLIDWQVTRYASPVTDLLYYLFSCIPKDLRDSHYDAFLRTYHESLSAHLKRLGSDPEKLFPYDVMLDQFRKFGKFGMVMATMLLPMLTSEEGQTPDLDELAEQLQDERKMDVNVFISDNSRVEFNKRLHDVVEDMVRLNYF